MNMKNHHLVFYVFLLLVPQLAIACRCTEPSIESAYNQADIVLRAKVEDVVEAPTGEGLTAILDISQSWKKSTKARAIVNTLTDCYYPFEKGKEYIVFVTIDPTGFYSTGKCNGNKSVTEAGALIQWLNQHASTQ